MKLLVAEDSHFFRISMERSLGKAGYDVVTAADGDEALVVARRERPDAILLDLLLPKMTGLDVLKALKEDASTRSIPVIVLTALSSKNASRLEKDGAAAYLEKNELILTGRQGEASELLTTVARVLQHPAAVD